MPKEKALIQAEDGTKVSFLANSLAVSTRMNACDDARFSVYLRDGESRPLGVGEPLSIYADEAFTKKVWAGTVDRYTETETIPVEGYARRITYECVCHSALAERYHVNNSFQDATVGDITRHILTLLEPEGVTEGVIDEGPIISEANFSYRRASSVLNEIGEDSGFGWFIDQFKRLHMQSRLTTEGSLQIDSGNRPFRTLEITRARRQYRNTQIVRGGKGETNERTETFVGDGTQRNFTLAFPVARKPTIEVNGLQQSVGISGLDNDKAWYWNKNDNTITQDQSETALTSSDTLSVTYTGLIPIAVKAQDRDAIDERVSVEGGAGVYENVVTDSSIEKTSRATERANALLRRFARVDERVKMELDNLTVRQGQIIEIDLPNRGLTGEYLIDEVSFQVRDDNVLRPVITLLSGEPYGAWTTYFRSLVEAKDEFTYRSNEQVLIQRLTDDDVTATDAATTSSGAPEDFIIGEDGSPVGSGSSIIGFVRIGGVGHGENTPDESVTMTEGTITISSSSDLTFIIGTSDVGYSIIG